MYSPVPQGVQFCDPVAAAKLCSGQSTHVSAPAADVVPTAQAEQVTAAGPEYKPAAQLAQAAVPFCAACVPTGHSKHCALRAGE